MQLPYNNCRFSLFFSIKSITFVHSTHPPLDTMECHQYVHKPKQKVIFHLEGALFKSSSLFPYFMLVAFEAGGPLRALTLLFLYPFICLVANELQLKIMVLICFAGIRKERIGIGSAILPKFFLEDIGCEGFDKVMSCGRKIAVSDLPRVMVEGFLKDYLGVEVVVGRELKVFCGYFLGLMEEKKATCSALKELLGRDKMANHAIGIGGANKFLNQQLFAFCKEIYSVTETEKKNWQILPRERYAKPLIFHDSRLAFRPTAFATIAMFMWLPFGFFLSIIRIVVGIILPYKLSIPITALTGTITVLSKPNHPFTSSTKNKGVLYVCNHRTVLDPIFVSLAVMKPVAAVTYGVSRFNEVISPIRTIRLTRDRERDRKLLDKMLSQGDLVVCPEGTTCREPYLLRFSPLFAEITDEIVTVAIDVQNSMFYGSTATGIKCLDPIFQLLNPRPIYFIKILENLQGSQSHMIGEASKFEVANYVQHKIAKTLGFECTSLTRKDKYMILAGNEGIFRTT